MSVSPNILCIFYSCIQFCCNNRARHRLWQKMGMEWVLASLFMVGWRLRNIIGSLHKKKQQSIVFINSNQEHFSRPFAHVLMIVLTSSSNSRAYSERAFPFGDWWQSRRRTCPLKSPGHFTIVAALPAQQLRCAQPNALGPLRRQ